MSNVLNYVKRLDSLIRMHATGSPSELACRLDISQRRLYELLNEMRNMGAPIRYSKIRQSYYYEKEGGITMHFVERRDIVDVALLVTDSSD